MLNSISRYRTPFFRMFLMLVVMFAVMHIPVSGDSGYVVITPTAEILPSGYFQLMDRFENNGNFSIVIGAGLFDFLEIGANFRVARLVGIGDMKLEEPQVLTKLQFLQESDELPAFTIGWDASEKEPIYDDEGNTINDTFYLRKGLYLVLSKRLFQHDIFGLKVVAGMNSPMKESYKGLALFTGAIVYIGQNMTFEMEIDNYVAANLLSKDNKDNDNDGEIDESSEEHMLKHFNSGISFIIAPNWEIRFLCLDINHDHTERNFSINFKIQF